MFNDKVMKDLLESNFLAWQTKQSVLDDMFFDGRFTKREYMQASLELAVQYMPKEGNIRQAHWR